MSFDPVTYAAVQQLMKKIAEGSQGDSTPIGLGVHIGSELPIVTDLQGRKFLLSGYMLPRSQVPGVSDDMTIQPSDITWTARTLPAGNYNSVTAHNGLFVAVGNNSVCATSLDGITWTKQTLPAGNYNSVTAHNGLFVAVGSSNVCATSLDGITWTKQTLPAGNYNSVTAHNGLFVAVGNSNVCATSLDGITWTARTLPTGNYNSVTVHDGLSVAVGSSNVCATAQLMPLVGFENHTPYLYMRIL